MMNDEKNARKNFWKKVKEAAGRVPFVKDAIALYFCALDPKTPTHVKVQIFAALAYFISPLDLVADFLPVGFMDDASVITLVLLITKNYITEEHFQKAKGWLNDNDQAQAS